MHGTHGHGASEHDAGEDNRVTRSALPSGGPTGLLSAEQVVMTFGTRRALRISGRGLPDATRRCGVRWWWRTAHRVEVGGRHTEVKINVATAALERVIDDLIVRVHPAQRLGVAVEGRHQEEGRGRGGERASRGPTA